MANFCLYKECKNPRFSHNYCQWHQNKRTDEKWKKSQLKNNCITKSKKKNSINFISDKLLKWLRIYRPIRDCYMNEHEKCEVEGCSKRSSALHHKRGRSYSSFMDEWAKENKIPLLIDVRFFMACCDQCHYKIHHEKTEWAYENEYLIPK